MSQASKKTVYLLHGLMGTCNAHFSFQIVRWAGQHRLLPIDLPGHGRCPKEADPAYYEDALRMAIAQVKHNGPGHLVGASYLGGTIALRIALAIPDYVDSVTVAGFAYDVPKLAFVEWAKAFIGLAQVRVDICTEYERLHGSRWRQTLHNAVFDIEHTYDTNVLTTTAMLASLAVPTCIVNGTLKTNEMEAAMRAEEANPLISTRIIPGGGHLIAFDRPDAFNEYVEQFWDQLIEPRRGDAHA